MSMFNTSFVSVDHRELALCHENRVFQHGFIVVSLFNLLIGHNILVSVNITAAVFLYTLFFIPDHSQLIVIVHLLRPW